MGNVPCSSRRVAGLSDERRPFTKTSRHEIRASRRRRVVSPRTGAESGFSDALLGAADMSLGARTATFAWLITAVYYFYQYALRSAPAVMMPQLSDAFGLSA